MTYLRRNLCVYLSNHLRILNTKEEYSTPSPNTLVCLSYIAIYVYVKLFSKSHGSLKQQHLKCNSDRIIENQEQKHNRLSENSLDEMLNRTLLIMIFKPHIYNIEIIDK